MEIFASTFSSDFDTLAKHFAFTCTLQNIENACRDLPHFLLKKTYCGTFRNLESLFSSLDLAYSDADTGLSRGGIQQTVLRGKVLENTSHRDVSVCYGLDHL